MICKRCGAELRKTDRFCSQCGAPVEKSQKTPAIATGEELWDDPAEAAAGETFRDDPAEAAAGEVFRDDSAGTVAEEILRDDLEGVTDGVTTRKNPAETAARGTLPEDSDEPELEELIEETISLDKDTAGKTVRTGRRDTKGAASTEKIPDSHYPTGAPESYYPGEKPEGHTPEKSPEPYYPGEEPEGYYQGKASEGHTPENSSETYYPGEEPEGYYQGNTPEAYYPGQAPETHETDLGPEVYYPGETPRENSGGSSRGRSRENSRDSFLENSGDSFLENSGSSSRKNSRRKSRKNSGEEKEIYYDESLYKDDKVLYRDTFLDKKEEKSHALLVTVAVLLLIAVVAVGFLMIYFFMMRSDTVAPGDGNAVQILTEDVREGEGADGGGDGVVLVTEAPGENAGTTGTQPGDTQTAAQNGDADQAAAQNGDGSQTAAQAGNADGAAATEAVTESETESETEAGAIDMARIQEIITGDSTATKLEVFIYDLVGGKTYATDGSADAMYASALISVPILYTAAVKLDAGEITLNDTITYVNSIGGRGEAYPEEREGQALSLSYYLTTMMFYSDNNCMNCLIDFFGLDEINRVCREAGFSSVDLQRKIVDEVTDGKDNYISAADLAGMVRDLYSGKYQTISSSFIQNYFKIDSGDGYRTVIGLAPELPADALFLNQNGRGDTRYNEVAVVAGTSCRYVISVMCNGDYGFQYETAVQNISSYVYQSLT